MSLRTARCEHGALWFRDCPDCDYDRHAIGWPTENGGYATWGQASFTWWRNERGLSEAVQAANRDRLFRQVEAQVRAEQRRFFSIYPLPR